MKAAYLTNCVNSTGPLIREMVECARPVTFSTFAKRCQWRAWADDMGYGPWLRLKNDWAVSFWSSRYQGRPCYYIDHSRIEYVFQVSP